MLLLKEVTDDLEDPLLVLRLVASLELFNSSFFGLESSEMQKNNKDV